MLTKESMASAAIKVEVSWPPVGKCHSATGAARITNTMSSQTPFSRAHRVTVLVVLVLVLSETHCQLLSGPRSWSSLLKRAFDLSRTAKWNEFTEEQKSDLVKTDNRTKSSQNLIDETKDPESPYYISMISSNIGGSHLGGNRSTGGNKRDPTSPQSGLVSKLFNYAFSTVTPSRVLQTTKRPLITFINVSNLEEHDSENLVKLNNLSDSTSSQLQLLNNADPNSSAFQKRRLPECATQQVCSAHYVKSNHTQRLCECAHDFNWNCEEVSHSDEHAIDLTRKQEYKTQRNNLEAYTQVKLCENLKSIKPCKSPTDWTIMALQSERTGKAHYVVVCKCPDEASFEGPFTHKHPPYARFPGIRVYGVRKSKDPKALEIDQNSEFPEFPWELAYAVINATTTQGFW